MSEKLRVAIVDDTPDMRLLVRLSLELDPFIEVVAEAEDGRGAIEVAGRHQPDVMLLDLAMPVMDGMQALPQVVRTSPRTVVLVLSGFAAGSMAEEAVAAGATAYLQKGIGADELCERVWRASGRQRPASPTTEPAPTTYAAQPRGEQDLAARAAEDAPVGVVVLGTPAGLRAADWLVLYVNREARAQLGRARDRVGERVCRVAPELAAVLDRLCRGEADRGLLGLDGGTVEVRARRAGDEVVVTLSHQD